MAERDKMETGGLPGSPGAETKAQWLVALEYVQENPAKVAGGFGFLILCVAIGGLISLKNIADDKKVTTDYALAIQTEDPGLRAAELARIAASANRWSAEALYLQGEASIEAKAYDKAREAFQQVLDRFGNSEYAPMAADGLAFLHENSGDYESALAGYTGVFEKWDATFTGRRQPLNIGRVQEALGNHAEAIARYRQQMEIFPDSSVARKANEALARLQVRMPELFPEDVSDAAPEAAIDIAPAIAVDTVIPEIPAEAPEASAEDAATEGAPAEDASADDTPAEAESAETEESPEASPAAEDAAEDEGAGSDS